MTQFRITKQYTKDAYGETGRVGCGFWVVETKRWWGWKFVGNFLNVQNAVQYIKDRL